MKKARCGICQARKPIKALRQGIYHNHEWYCRNKERCKSRTDAWKRANNRKMTDRAGFLHMAVSCDWWIFGRYLPKPNNLIR